MSQAIKDPTKLPDWGKSTSGRSGKSYAGFLAANPTFDPYTNLDTYVGPGGSQSAAAQQAFGWLNEWARNNGYGDGARIPLAQRQQMYVAFLERARQGVADRGEVWENDAASKLANKGWEYQAGWGLANGGKSYEMLNQPAPPPTPPPDPNALTPADLAAKKAQENAAAAKAVAAAKKQAEDLAAAEAAKRQGQGGGAMPEINGTPGTDPALLNQGIGADKTTRMALLLQALGLGSPRAQHNMLGGKMADFATGIFDPWTTTQGIDGTGAPLDSYQDMINKFARYMQSQGGIGNIRADASNALQNITGGRFGGHMDDTELMGLVGNYNELAGLNTNVINQRLRGNLMDESMGQYALANVADARGRPNGVSQLDYLSYLASNPTYKFLTGR